MLFKKIKLGEILTIKHGWAFKGEFFSDNGDLIVVTPGNFYDKGGFKQIKGKEKFYTDVFPEEYLLSKDDLIIAMTEQAEGLLGSPALVPSNNIYLHNQRIGLIKIIDEKKVNKFFIYYLFFTEKLKKIIGNKATGTKVRHTAPKSIYGIDVLLPPLKIQNKIATLLSNYDNLIQNNTKRIKLLEEMAEELYKEWFVRLRFPEYEKSKIVDGIPEGWEEKRFLDFGKIITGKTPLTSKEEYYNGNIPFIKTPDFKQGLFLVTTEETLTKAGAQTQKNQYIEKNAICVSCIGTVGEVIISTQKSQTNQQINTVNLYDINYLEYMYFSIKKLKPLILAYSSTGATMGNLSKGKFEKIKLLMPNIEIISKFHNMCSPLFDEIKILQQKNQTLKQTRDLLLLRVMSGKLDVRNLPEENNL